MIYFLWVTVSRTIKWQRFCFISSRLCSCYFLMDRYHIFFDSSNYFHSLWFAKNLCGKELHERIHHIFKDFFFPCASFILTSLFSSYLRRHLFWLIDYSWIWRWSQKERQRERERIKTSAFNHNLFNFHTL